jgi:hypothetical protein
MLNHPFKGLCEYFFAAYQKSCGPGHGGKWNHG